MKLSSIDSSFNLSIDALIPIVIKQHWNNWEVQILAGMTPDNPEPQGSTSEMAALPLQNGPTTVSVQPTLCLVSPINTDSEQTAASEGNSEVTDQ